MDDASAICPAAAAPSANPLIFGLAPVVKIWPAQVGEGFPMAHREQCGELGAFAEPGDQHRHNEQDGTAC